MLSIDEVMSIGEAADIWAMNQKTIQFACLGQKGYPPRFHPDECRKSGKVWLVTRAGMTRLYGEPKNK